MRAQEPESGDQAVAAVEALEREPGRPWQWVSRGGGLGWVGEGEQVCRGLPPCAWCFGRLTFPGQGGFCPELRALVRCTLELGFPRKQILFPKGPNLGHSYVILFCSPIKGPG